IISHKENIANHEQKYDSQDYERDTWDALTDGQYGDYPEDGIDIVGLLESMGRGEFLKLKHPTLHFWV
ncbi:MAG: hypothetical protein ACK5LL_00355, partial [Suipraeoptans sp.]